MKRVRSRRRKHRTLVWWGKFRKENDRQYRDNYRNQRRWRQVKKAEDERMIRKTALASDRKE